MKSQFRAATGSHVYLLSHRGKYHVEAKKDAKRGDFVITVNKRIVDRQKKAAGTIQSFKFWIANAADYTRIYFVQPKKGRGS